MSEPEPIPPPPATGRREHLLVRSGGTLRFVRTAEIRWIAAEGHNLSLHLAGETLVVRQSIGRFERMLDERRFARIHRSTIVNVAGVREVHPWFAGGYLVVLHDGTELRATREYWKRLTPRFGLADG